MNNAVFGKSMENVRNRRIFKMINSERLITKYVNRPEFTSCILINEATNLTLVELKQKKIKFDKPLQVGAAILDISKCVMVDFHYQVMKPMIDGVGDGSNLELMYCDTVILTH